MPLSLRRLWIPKRERKKKEVHCRSAFEPGASGLPYYCTPPVCIPDVLGALIVWQHTKTKVGAGGSAQNSFLFAESTRGRRNFFSRQASLCVDPNKKALYVPASVFMSLCRVCMFSSLHVCLPLFCTLRV